MCRASRLLPCLLAAVPWLAHAQAGDAVGLSIDTHQVRWFSGDIHSSKKESLEHA